MLIVGSFFLADNLSTGLFAFGCGLIGASLAKLIIQHQLAKSPGKRKAYEISENDPRHQEIRIRSYAYAGRFLELTVILLAMVLSFAGQPLWLVGTLLVLFLGYQLVAYFSMVSLNKKM